MKRILLLTFIIVLFNVSLAGCGDGKADMEGIVLDVNEHGIELARAISSEEYETIKHESITKLHNEDVAGERDLGLIDITYDHKDELSKGEEVDVWIDGDIMDSYPPQADAKTISLKK